MFFVRLVIEIVLSPSNQKRAYELVRFINENFFIDVDSYTLHLERLSTR
jgi:hypothetical protein